MFLVKSGQEQLNACVLALPACLTSLQLDVLIEVLLDVMPG
jgi:hypothetical protein